MIFCLLNGQSRGQRARMKKTFMTLIFPPQLTKIAADIASKYPAEISNSPNPVCH